MYLINISFNTFTSKLGIKKKKDRIEFSKSLDLTLLLKRIVDPISILKKRIAIGSFDHGSKNPNAVITTATKMYLAAQFTM